MASAVTLTLNQKVVSSSFLRSYDANTALTNSINEAWDCLMNTGNPSVNAKVLIEAIAAKQYHDLKDVSSISIGAITDQDTFKKELSKLGPKYIDLCINILIQDSFASIPCIREVGNALGGRMKGGTITGFKATHNRGVLKIEAKQDTSKYRAVVPQGDFDEKTASVPIESTVHITVNSLGEGLKAQYTVKNLPSNMVALKHGEFVPSTANEANIRDVLHQNLRFYSKNVKCKSRLIGEPHIETERSDWKARALGFLLLLTGLTAASGLIFKSVAAALSISQPALIAAIPAAGVGLGVAIAVPVLLLLLGAFFMYKGRSTYRPVAGSSQSGSDADFSVVTEAKSFPSNSQNFLNPQQGNSLLEPLLNDKNGMQVEGMDKNRNDAQNDRGNETVECVSGDKPSAGL